MKAAHDKGIIYRDVKSENIMIYIDNMVKIMDFGLAKLKNEARLSRTSSTAGTIAYMTPEQLQGFEVDARTEIFSFCVVMYEMLTCYLPFRRVYESPMMYSIINTDPEKQFQKLKHFLIFNSKCLNFLNMYTCYNIF